MAPYNLLCQKRDVHIAHQIVGEGLFDLVFIHGLVSHLEYQWEDSALAQFSR
jgi:hypothetical protein